MKTATLLLLATLVLTCGGKTAKIFYINSYHVGYGSSDEIMAGIDEILADEVVELEKFIMDSKRNPDEEYLQRKASEAVERIETLQPDVILASDDNAVKYIIAPYFKDGPVPVLFCGVNWSCEPYGLPSEYVTGMLEVLPVEEIISTLQEYYPRARTMTVISENSHSERKNREFLDPLYRRLGLQVSYALVNTFDEWKTAFVRANEESDLVFFITNGAIKDWDDNIAKVFAEKKTRKPVFTVEDFIMPYAVIGFTKVAREQGQWVARKALDLVNGCDIADIELTQNRRTARYINLKLARKIGFHPSVELLNECVKVDYQ